MINFLRHAFPQRARPVSGPRCARANTISDATDFTEKNFKKKHVMSCKLLPQNSREVGLQWQLR